MLKSTRAIAREFGASPGSWHRDVLSRQLHEPHPAGPKASAWSDFFTQLSFSNVLLAHLQPILCAFRLKRFKYCKMYQLMRSKEVVFLVKYNEAER